MNFLAVKEWSINLTVRSVVHHVTIGDLSDSPLGHQVGYVGFEISLANGFESHTRLGVILPTVLIIQFACEWIRHGTAPPTSYCNPWT